MKRLNLVAYTSKVLLERVDNTKEFIKRKTITQIAEKIVDFVSFEREECDQFQVKFMGSVWVTNDEFAQ